MSLPKTKQYTTLTQGEVQKLIKDLQQKDLALQSVRGELAETLQTLAQHADVLTRTQSENRNVGKQIELANIEVKELRNRLYQSEMAYAKLMGYVDRIRDEQPPQMIPNIREGHIASYPDGTLGTSNDGMWRSSSAPAKRWFDK